MLQLWCSCLFFDLWDWVQGATSLEVGKHACCCSGVSSHGTVRRPGGASMAVACWTALKRRWICCA